MSALRTWAGSFWGVLVLTACLRALFASLAPLSGDEAYYWDCSRHLDWSYFDQPPLVIWAMLPARLLLGDTVLAVRLPAILAGVAAGYFFGRILVELGGTYAQAARMWLLLHATPLVFVGFGYASTDALMTAAYAAATWAVILIAKGRVRGWWGFGLAVGLGFLGKYPVVLALGGLAGALAFSRAARAHLRGPVPYLAALLCLALSAPVWIWGALHDWDNITFQLGRIPSGFSPGDSVEFVLVTLGLAGLFLGWAAVRSWWRSLSHREPSWRAFQAASLAPFAVFGVLSLRGHVGQHWGGPSIFLACVPLAMELDAFPRLVRAGVVTGISVMLLAASVVAAPRAWLGLERRLREYEGRPEKIELKALFGQARIAREVAARLRPGELPVTDGYTPAHLISFQLPQAVPSRMAHGSGLHGLASLYWYPPSDFLGRDVLFWTEKPFKAEELRPRFASIEELEPLPIEVDGRALFVVHFYRCRDLRDPRPLFTRLSE